MTEAVEGAASHAAPDAAMGDDAPRASARAADVRADDGAPRRSQARAVFAMFWDGVRTVVLALLLSFTIRVIVVEPFHVPTESMEPTLVPGDYIGASKFPYGWSRVSVSPLPLPMVAGRFLGHTPARGELIVFRNWRDNGADYVKRVIGLPGDRVQMRDGVAYLNGEPAALKPVEEYDGVDPVGDDVRVLVYQETLPGGCSYRVQHYLYADGHREGQDDTYEFIVPDGHLFVMGDNRDASYDSRLPGRVGYVPIVDVIGRAQFVFASVAPGFDLRDIATWRNVRGDRTLKPLACG